MRAGGREGRTGVQPTCSSAERRWERRRRGDATRRDAVAEGGGGGGGRQAVSVARQAGAARAGTGHNVWRGARLRTFWGLTHGAGVICMCVSLCVLPLGPGLARPREFTLTTTRRRCDDTHLRHGAGFPEQPRHGGCPSAGRRRRRRRDAAAGARLSAAFAARPWRVWLGVCVQMPAQVRGCHGAATARMAKHADAASSHEPLPHCCPPCFAAARRSPSRSSPKRGQRRSALPSASSTR